MSSAIPVRRANRGMHRGSRDERRVLVGIDFGTTFSGMAYVDTLDVTRQFIIKSGRGAREGDKVPTLLKYDNGGFTGPFKWGLQVPEKGTRHEWFKLGLCPEAIQSTSSLAQRYPSRTAYGDVDDRTCQSLVVDFLTCLRKRVDDYFRETDLIPETIRKEYIITVPAVWTAKAQNATRICAERAGMGTFHEVTIVSEPEAAGIWAIDLMRNKELKKDDAFVICDAGGGTVDLASYVVKSLEPAKLTERATGSGDVCGSVFLDRIFEEYLENRYSEVPGWDNDYKSEAMKIFVKEFKPEFTGIEDAIIAVRGLKDYPSLGIEDGELIIPAKDIKEKIFDPVIRRIVKLVKNQIAKTHDETGPIKITKVLLAGGFGRNEYLRKKLQREVARDIKVIRVEDGNTAIVKGALIKGLMDKEPSENPKYPYMKVDSRIAKKSYGIKCYDIYDPTRHRRDQREPHPFDGGDQVTVVSWCVTKNSSVREDQPSIFEFSQRLFSQNGHPEEIVCSIFTCEADRPPCHPDDTVKEHVELRADIRDVPENELKRKGQHYCLDFIVEMILKSANLDFTLIFNGKRYGHIVATFM